MPLPFYPFYWADYSSKTFNLTQGQHGAYMLFLRHLYAVGKPIPHEQRWSIAKAMLQQEQQNADAVLEEFFVRVGDGWTHERVSEIMDEAEEAHARRVKAGKARGKGKKQPPAGEEQSSSNAEAMLKQPESEPESEPRDKKDSWSDAPEGEGEKPPAPPKVPEKPKTAAKVVEGLGEAVKHAKGVRFDEFWLEYPHKVAKGAARKAWEKATAKTSPVTIIESAKAFARLQAGKEEQFIPHPATWLNAERWQDAALAEKPQGPALQVKPGGIVGNIIIAEGTPQWLAWCDYRKTTKFPAPVARPVTDPKTMARLNGWYFPSEWPPTLKGET